MGDIQLPKRPFYKGQTFSSDSRSFNAQYCCCSSVISSYGMSNSIATSIGRFPLLNNYRAFIALDLLLMSVLSSSSSVRPSNHRIITPISLKLICTISDYLSYSFILLMQFNYEFLFFFLIQNYLYRYYLMPDCSNTFFYLFSAAYKAYCYELISAVHFVPYYTESYQASLKLPSQHWPAVLCICMDAW